MKSIIITNSNRLFAIYMLCYASLACGDAFEMGMASMKAGDYAEAYCLWRPLAMQGHVEAAYHLGWLYANGNGLRVDVSKAVYWWSRAASSGHRDAMFALALAYTNGEGIKKNDEEAMRWYLKAAAMSHEDAREIIKTKVRNQSKEVLPHLKSLLQERWVGQQVEISAPRANLRSGPGTRFEVTGTVEQGVRFVAVHRQGKWMRIIDPVDFNYAWVADWLVERVDESR